MEDEARRHPIKDNQSQRVDPNQTRSREDLSKKILAQNDLLKRAVPPEVRPRKRPFGNELSKQDLVRKNTPKRGIFRQRPPPMATARFQPRDMEQNHVSRVRARLGEQYTGDGSGNDGYIESPGLAPDCGAQDRSVAHFLVSQATHQPGEPMTSYPLGSGLQQVTNYDEGQIQHDMEEPDEVFEDYETAGDGTAYGNQSVAAASDPIGRWEENEAVTMHRQEVYHHKEGCCVLM